MPTCSISFTLLSSTLFSNSPLSGYTSDDSRPGTSLSETPAGLICFDRNERNPTAKNVFKDLLLAYEDWYHLDSGLDLEVLRVDWRTWYVKGEKEKTWFKRIGPMRRSTTDHIMDLDDNARLDTPRMYDDCLSF
ncbi:hypothetical protein BGZ90_005956 [Linnemannia elongata]|nr:hypothetical protein BGZ90_005956 [Linnemannia elongata]